jgi:hypothetical protein
VCCWPELHKHLQEWGHHGTFRGVIMGQVSPDQQRPGLRAGTRENIEREVEGEEGMINIVIKNSTDMCEYLYKGLGEVYSEEDLAMVHNIRTVLDLKEKVQSVAVAGHVRAAQRSVTKFMDAARIIDPEMLEQCDMAEWREQYRTFYGKLGLINLLPGSENFSSMEVMVRLLNTEGQLFKGCEAVIGILVQAAAMKSVESVVESWISVLEHHSSKSRNLSEDMIETEMSVAINGPAVQHSESIVTDSMRKYWAGGKMFKDGHFVRKSLNIKSYFVSGAVDSLNKIQKKNNLML